MKEKMKDFIVITEPSVSDHFKKWFVKNLSSNSRWLFLGAVIAFSLLGFFSSAPLAILIILKITFLVSLLSSVLMAIKSLWDGFNQRKDHSISNYFVEEQISPWFESWPNRLRLFFGTILFIGVLTLLICSFPGMDVLSSTAMPGLQPLFAWVSSCIHFFSQGFLHALGELLTERTAPIVASVFLTVLTLTMYDILCSVLQYVFPFDEKKQMVDDRRSDHAEIKLSHNPTSNESFFSHDPLFKPENRNSATLQADPSINNENEKKTLELI